MSITGGQLKNSRQRRPQTRSLAKHYPDQNFDLMSQISFPPIQQRADKIFHVRIFGGSPFCQHANGPPTSLPSPRPPQRSPQWDRELASWDANGTSRKGEKVLPPGIQSFNIIKRRVRTRATNKGRVDGRRFWQQKISRK